jgi:hypothetical protein
MRKLLVAMIGLIVALGVSMSVAELGVAQPKDKGKAATKTACPPDQRYSRKEKGCVARCQPPRTYDVKRRRCTCPEGQVYNRRKKACVARCQPPRTYDVKRRRCMCPEGQVYKRKTKTCAPRPEPKSKAKSK